jgi:hypothetical protein
MTLIHSSAANPLPVQLTLQLLTRDAPTRRSPATSAPYWVHVDLADVGGQLRARNHAVRVLLDADAAADGTWIGYYDALFTQSGVSGPTRAHSTRQDALASAAYAVAGHCRHLLGDVAGSHPRADVRAAREVVRWLEMLDLL